MGVIQRQGFKHVFVIFAGMALGAINMLFLYPRFLNQDEFGIFQYVVRNAQMLYPFALLGASGLIIRYFPNVRQSKNDIQGFFLYMLVWALVGLGSFLLFAALGWEWVLGFFQDKSPYFTTYLAYLLPIMVSMGLTFFLTSFSTNFNRIVVPALFNNFFLKLLLGGLILLVGFGVIDFHRFMQGVSLAYLSVVVSILIYQYFQGQIRFDFCWWNPGKAFFKQMMVYAGFSLLGNASLVLASQIDIFMVGLMIDLSNVAIYSIGFLIADVIDVPRRSIEQISAPQIAQAWADGDREHIASLYRKSSLNQLAVGLFILLCIWLPLDSLFELIPNGEKYAAGKEVVLILGVGKLIDMMTGINRLVIVYSSYYRFIFYATLILALLNVVSNLIFIPIFLIAGAALATTFTTLIYNLTRVWFVWYKFKLHPFSVPMGWMLLLAMVVYLAGTQLPDSSLPVLNIGLKLALVGLFFGGGVYFLRLAPELNGMANQALGLVRRFLDRTKKP